MILHFNVIMLLCIYKLIVAKIDAYLIKIKLDKLSNSMVAASELYLSKGNEQGFI